MAWIYLIIAGLLEIGWAISIKSTEGFTRLGPSLITLGLMSVSFYLLGLALRTLPVGTGYAVWTGIGAAGTAIIGVIWLGEPRDLSRLACIGLIVAGVLGLKLLHAPSPVGA